MRKPKEYASGTEVSIDRSINEIRNLLKRYGATDVERYEGEDRALVGFTMRERRIRFEVAMPDFSEERFHQTVANQYGTPRQRSREQASGLWEQACRERWRQLALVIKAKLVAVEAGVTEFEDEFMANIVMPDGQTVAQKIRPQIEQAYLENKPGPLLLGYSGANPGGRRS